ncbi:aldehyde dehydrogenase family protein [Thermaerobacter marianensis]|nr:aldehyde dehydrogenase family protein [Thermaerobacter marianensis]
MMRGGAADAAAAAFPEWSETGPGEHRRLLLKAADLLEERAAPSSRP